MDEAERLCQRLAIIDNGSWAGREAQAFSRRVEVSGETKVGAGGTANETGSDRPRMTQYRDWEYGMKMECDADPYYSVKFDSTLAPFLFSGPFS